MWANAQRYSGQVTYNIIMDFLLISNKNVETCPTAHGLICGTMETSKEPDQGLFVHFILDVFVINLYVFSRRWPPPLHQHCRLADLNLHMQLFSVSVSALLDGK